MPDQPQIVMVRADVYEFQPFGQYHLGGCFALDQHEPDAIERVRTSDGTMEICKRCSTARFVPAELTPQPEGN